MATRRATFRYPIIPIVLVDVVAIYLPFLFTPPLGLWTALGPSGLTFEVLRRVGFDLGTPFAVAFTLLYVAVMVAVHRVFVRYLKYWMPVILVFLSTLQLCLVFAIFAQGEL